MTLTGVALTSGHPAAAASMTTASISPATSVVFVVVHYANTGSSPGDVQSISGLGGTWQQCGASILSANGNNRLALWYGYGCSGSGTLLITPTATPNSQNSYEVCEFTGGIKEGVNAIVASNYKSVAGTATANNVTVTPNTLQSQNNAFLVGVQHKTAENVTPSQGTEIHDDNAGSAAGCEINYISPWTSGGMGGTWATTTGSQGRVVGVEVKATDGVIVAEHLPFVPRGRSM